MDESKHMPYELPVCVIVELKQSTITEESKWRTDLEKTCIPIVPVAIHYEKRWWHTPNTWCIQHMRSKGSAINR